MSPLGHLNRLRALVELCRPRQQVKNGLIWLPLFFGHKLLEPAAVWSVLWAFAAFCLAAGGVYVFNDVLDAREDRGHPLKKQRPVARGAVAAGQAVIWGTALMVAAAAVAAAFLPGVFLLWLLAYLALNAAYTLVLKHVALLDITAIALGFVIRVLAGGVAAAVVVSHWLVIMTFLAALFLALAKRRDDLLLAAAGHSRRRSTGGYSLEFIATAMAVMAAVTIVAYVLYTVSPDTLAKHGSQHLYLTAFWVVVGFLRFLQVTLVRQESGSPTWVLWRDKFLQAVLAAWLLNWFVFLYIR